MILHKCQNNKCPGDRRINGQMPNILFYLAIPWTLKQHCVSTPFSWKAHDSIKEKDLGNYNLSGKIIQAAVFFQHQSVYLYFCKDHLQFHFKLQFEGDIASFSFYASPTHPPPNPPIRTCSDFNSNCIGLTFSSIVEACVHLYTTNGHSNEHSVEISDECLNELLKYEYFRWTFW